MVPVISRVNMSKRKRYDYLSAACWIVSESHMRRLLRRLVREAVIASHDLEESSDATPEMIAAAKRIARELVP